MEIIRLVVRGSNIGFHITYEKLDSSVSGDLLKVWPHEVLLSYASLRGYSLHVVIRN